MLLRILGRSFLMVCILTIILGMTTYKMNLEEAHYLLAMTAAFGFPALKNHIEVLFTNVKFVKTQVEW